MGAIFTLLRRSLKAAWRRRWLGVAIAWVICLAGWAGVSRVPNQYEASARLYIDTNAVLTPLLKNLAVDSSPDAQLRVLQSTLVSRPNIQTLISKTDLDLAVTDPAQRDALVTGLMSAISVKSDNRLNLFTIQYSNPSPKLARDVVQTLLTIFIESATGGNRRDMQDARVFLQHQIASYEQQLRTTEARRAEFRAKYPGLVIADTNNGTPEGANPLDTLQAHIAQTESALQEKTALVAALKKDLETMQPTLPDTAGGQGAPTTLAGAEQKLRMLRLQYTDAFPDVIATQKLIEALKTSPAKGGAGGHATPNPGYDQLKLRILDLSVEADGLKRQLTSMQESRVKLLELQRLRPNLLAEYQNITRDYSILRTNYDELLARLQSANIGEAADTQADKVQVRVVDPPVVPIIPSSPNRILLVSMVLIIGLAVGAAVPILLSQLDRSFWVVEDLRSLGLPVLGGISLLTGISIRRRMLAVTSFSVAVIVLIGLYGGLMFRILRATAVV